MTIFDRDSSTTDEAIRWRAQQEVKRNIRALRETFMLDMEDMVKMVHEAYQEGTDRS